MNWSIILASVCGIAVAQGLFLGALLISRNKKEFGSNFFLGLAIIGVSLRIGKSLVYYYWLDMSLWGVALGGVGLWSIGPATYLYILSLKGQLNYYNRSLHFLPSLLLLFSATIFGWAEMSLVYAFGVAHLFVYFFLSIYHYIIFKEIRSKTSTLFLVSVGLLGITFMLQWFADNIQFYALGGLIASVELYLINFAVASNIQKKKIISKGKMSSVKKETLQIVIEKVQLLFDTEQVYREPKLTLNKLAYRLNQPVYILRQAIIQIEKKNFNDYVNGYRIAEVKKLLEDENPQYTIEGMAYDVGFSSTSSFYEAFKKVTKCTPVEYKKGLTIV